MRLTLRTLLAYLDGILEPADAEDIGKKIEESEFATGLMHRVRDVVRRLRLAAPSLTDRGPGLDPNTVAEYLDNTLPSDRLPDFEKVCLESDIHLAEVASCHQILTLVLGEPAEIDPASRQRMYQLPNAPAAQAEPEDRSTDMPATGQGDKAAVGSTVTRRPREKPEIPDYLREPARKRRWLPLAAALLLVAGLGLFALKGLGYFDDGTFLGNLIARVRGDRVAMGPNVPGDLPETVAQGVAPIVVEQGVEQAPSPVPAETPRQPAPPIEGKPAAPGVPDATSETQPALKDGVTVKPEATSADPAKPPVAPPVAEPDSTAPPGPLEVAKVDPTPPIKTPPTPQAVPKVDPNQPAAEPAGRFLSEKDVLLFRDPDDGIWRRVAPQSPILPKRTLLALPTFRPALALTNGIGLQLIGGAEIELLPVEAGATPSARMGYGRLVVRSLAKGDARVRLLIGSQTAIITPTDVESVAAVEVKTVRPAGTHPETTPGSLAIDLYCVSGRILRDDGDGKPPASMEAPSYVALDQTTRTVVTVQEFPRWITTESVSPVDRLASGTMEQTLQLDRPAGLQLKEMADHRKREVRWLAIRCLACLDDFDALTGALNDPVKKPEWPDYIEWLLAAVGRGPATAAAVRQALEKQYAKEAPSLYRMLWGYSDKDLQNGEDQKLVEALDAELLAARVLSFWNLRDLTGWGLYYQPELTAAKRRLPVGNWRKRLEASEIRLEGPGAKEERPDAEKSPVPAKAAAPRTLPGTKTGDDAERLLPPANDLPGAGQPAKPATESPLGGPRVPAGDPAPDDTTLLR